MKRNKYFLETAQKLTPTIHKRKITVAGTNQELGKGDCVVFDFEDHYVGTVAIKLGYTGRHPDAPLYLSISFCEHESELREQDGEYHGWISESWIQKELVHVDELPGILKLTRRYAFRYVVIKVIGISSNYRAVVESITATTVTSADDRRPKPLRASAREQKIDAVAIRTLRNCMQSVFEDGPKRDRRLWLGDLRLEALANYETYRDYNLVKRCLYLFAGCTLDNGAVASNMFLTPEVECDDQSMFDYALFFINTLWDYYEATGDDKTVSELFTTAFRQYELARERFADCEIIPDSEVLGWCFVDWNLNLNKQASAQAIYVYALKSLVKLCTVVGRPHDDIAFEIEQKSAAARNTLWDTERGAFVSGEQKQISQATQIWMVLAGVVDRETAKTLLTSEPFRAAERIVTPYAYHGYVQALINIGETELAKKVMLDYWGKMVDLGADTFWELFDPEDPDASPYGGKVVNSYCHAWSCTPTYFLRRYFC